MASTLFSGGDRFEVVDRLGAGSMGYVYRVQDRDRGGEEVALNLLNRFAAAARWQLSRLENSNASRGLGEQTREWFAGQNVVAPDRLSHILIPGPFGAPDED